MPVQVYPHYQSLAVTPLEDRITPYAVNLPTAAANPVHEDLTQYGYELFNRQFGDHDLKAVSGILTQLRDGARDEDNGKQTEPFRDSQPSLRHFWNHDVSYNRSLYGLNAGLGGLYESAPARAIRIFGLENGIAELFRTDASKAARFLGHAAHLLQDVTVPAHAHADPHLDGGQPLSDATDFDPYHDFVDGIVFSKTGTVHNGETYVASFNDDPATHPYPRHEEYAKLTDSDAGKDLRNPGQFPTFEGDRLAGLFADNARAAEQYDTKDYVGRNNSSILYDRGRPILVDTPTAFGIRQFFPSAAYDSFSWDELKLQAQDLVPRAVRTTAELVRYFYSLTDTDDPIVDLPKFCSTDYRNPQAFPSGRIDLVAAATDQDSKGAPKGTDSGVGKDFFKFEYATVGTDGSLGQWQEAKADAAGSFFTDGGGKFGTKFAGKHGATGQAGLNAASKDVFAIKASAEDGAGRRGTSATYYVRYGDPAVTEITVIDQSGSMDGSPLTSAIASASGELGSRNDYDRVGVVSFSSSATVQFPLTTITPGSQVREQAQKSIAGLTASGGTSIGSGLLAALGMLDPNHPDNDCRGQTSIVVLTDGDENESPYIADVEGQIPGYVTVHGIALGSGADATAVQRLARNRGGQFFASTDPSGLPGIYARVSGAVTGEQDVARRAGKINTGERQMIPFQVDATAGGLTVGVTWPGSDLDLTVIDPTGRAYTHADPGSGRYAIGTTAEFFRLAAAMPGTWQLVLDGVTVDAGGEPFEAFARVATPLTAELLTPTQTLAAGSVLPIRLRLTNGSPVFGATVRAALIPPDPDAVPALNVTLFDDGTHGDEMANDGIYSNDAPVGAVGGGVYTLQVEATGPGFVRTPSQQLLITGSAPANTAPTITMIGNQTSTGRVIGPLDTTVADAETPADSLRVTATSSNSLLFPAGAITLTGTGAGRQVTLTPATGRTGLATITLTVTDSGGMTTTDTFDVTVTAVVVANTPPTISDIPNQPETPNGVPVGPLRFTIGDAETPLDSLTGIGTSSNTALIPNGNLIFGGSGANRTITVTPVAGQFGTTTITLTVTDANGLTATDIFVVTVNAVPVVLPTAKPVLVGFPQFAAGSDAGGGVGTVTLYDPDGSVRFGVAPFAGFSGGVRAATADFNNDGVADLIIGTGPGIATQVIVYDGKSQAVLFSVAPFEASFIGGVYLSAGDVTGDGIPDLAITPDEGGGPRVDIYSGAAGFPKIASFFGIDDTSFRGGARSAIADMTGDGVADLIVVAGFGGGPRVAAFDGTSLDTGAPDKIIGDFFAFEQALRNGIFVTAGDINGDGFADLIAGGGPGGGPRVLTLDGKSLLTNQYVNLANFFGGDVDSRGGIRVAVKDLDGDTRADLIVGSGAGAGSRVTGYLGKNIGLGGTPATQFDFDAIDGFTGGVFVG